MREGDDLGIASEQGPKGWKVDGQRRRLPQGSRKKEKIRNVVVSSGFI